MDFTDKKTISIILPHLNIGGVERMRIHLAQEFIKKGFNVEFVLFRERGELLDLVPKDTKITSLKAGRLIKGFYPLVQYINCKKPHVILAAMWPVSVIAIWAVKWSKHNPTIVVSEHNQISSTTVYTKGKKGLNKWLIPFSIQHSYPYADNVVGVSKGVISDLQNLSGIQLTSAQVVYNPAAPEPKEIKKLNTNNEYWNAKSSRKIISIGTLKKQKDYPTLLRAFKIVKQKLNIELLILGDGPEKKNIKKLLTELKLKKNVHMPGFVKNPISYLKGADLFVLSSAWEGFGNVIVEALSCGVPVVSTDCKSGPAEILENGKYGTLVPVGDPDALAQAILENLEKTHDPAPLKKRAQDFSAEKIADQYLRLMFPQQSEKE